MRAYGHDGARPRVDPSAYVAPTATLVGDVTVGPEARVMHGATVVAEGGSIAIGRRVIVLENAVLRAIEERPLSIGESSLVGPCAHLVGCTVEPEVFVATGAAIFHGAVLERGSEVRVHGVVHVGSRLVGGTTVPIGWVAVGDPAQVLPPGRHDEIWSIQEGLHFPRAAYGLDRAEATMGAITARLAARLGRHAEDEQVDGES